MVFCDIWPQILAALLCNISVLTFGLQAGWLSPLQLSFQSENSPLGIPPLTDEEISWIGAVPSISLTISAPIFGWIMDRFGRKTALFVATAPNIISYGILFFASSVPLVCVSRFIGGFCSCGGFVVGPIYVNEMVEPKLRGLLGSLTGFFVKLGIILSFVLGAYFSYLFLNIFSISFTIIFLIFYTWLPESPVYLISKGNYLKSEIEFSKLWRGESSKLIKEEMKEIKENCKDAQSEINTYQLLKKFATDRRLRNGMIIVMCIFGFQMFSGYPAIVRYAADVIRDAGSFFPADNAAILFAITQLVCSFIGAFLLDKLGRKTLIVYNLLLMSTCTGVIAIYVYLSENFKDNTVVESLQILPTIALVLFFACYAFGFGTVPFVIIPELFAPEKRSYASTILNMWFALAEFVVVKLLPTFSNLFHLYGCLAILSVISYAGVALLQLLMFETKGLSFNAVQDRLSSFRRRKSIQKYKSKEDIEVSLPLSKTRPHC